MEASLKSKASKTPIEVAIPFPPLNCKKIGQSWPRTTPILASNWPFNPPNLYPIYELKKPFDMSSIKVARPSFFP